MPETTLLEDQINRGREKHAEELSLEQANEPDPDFREVDEPEPAADSFPSTSDRRTENNVMRHEYRILNDEEKAQMLLFKDMGRAFVTYCDTVWNERPEEFDGSRRELSLAKTKMEEAVMWAVKHITR